MANLLIPYCGHNFWPTIRGKGQWKLVVVKGNKTKRLIQLVQNKHMASKGVNMTLILLQEDTCLQVKSKKYGPFEKP